MPNARRILESDYLKLLPIVVLAFFIAFIPHLNYPYPVHLDEWTHLAASNQIVSQGSVTDIVDPFSGGSPILNQIQEFGFYVFWAVFRLIGGVSMVTIFRFSPAIIFVVTVMSVFVLARRVGFGWEAAFFTSLIPTSVGILGPAFMVPVAMALLFIPLSIFTVSNFNGWRPLIVLSIFMTFLFSIHGATALVLTLLLIPFALANLKENIRYCIGIISAAAVPFIAFLVAFPWMRELVLYAAIHAVRDRPIPAFVEVPPVIATYGYLPFVFFLVGAAALSFKGNMKTYPLVIGQLILLILLVVKFRFNRGEAAIYFRGLIVMMLLAGIIAGAGLNLLRNRWPPESLRSKLKLPGLARGGIGLIFSAVVVAVALTTAIPDKLHARYYRMIDEQDYRAFVWIKDHVDQSYAKAVLDPWKGTAFAALTGKNVYSRITEYPTESDQKAYDFLRNRSSDTEFLRQNGISIVYTTIGSDNPDLTEVRTNVYLLKEDSQP